MSLALKRTAPIIYDFLKKFERYVPASATLWDKKECLVFKDDIAINEI